MARKSNHGILDWFADFSLHSLLLHPATLFFGATIALFLIAASLWQGRRDNIAQQFPLTEENLNVNSPPDWLSKDIESDVFVESGLENASLLDADVVPRVRDAFVLHPWVAEVQSVKKSNSGVRVDLTYRRPVAMVEIGNRLLLPIDSQGVVLDGRQFNKELLDDFVRIEAGDIPASRIVAGQTWPEPGVLGATKIASALAQIQGKPPVQRIRINRPHDAGPGAVPSNQLPQYELQMDNGTYLFWGSGPGDELPGEASTAQKIEVLTAPLLTGQLHSGRGHTTRRPPSFDIRHGTLRRITPMQNVGHRRGGE